MARSSFESQFGIAMPLYSSDFNLILVFLTRLPCDVYTGKGEGGKAGRVSGSQLSLGCCRAEALLVLPAGFAWLH